MCLCLLPGNSAPKADLASLLYFNKRTCQVEHACILCQVIISAGYRYSCMKIATATLLLILTVTQTYAQNKRADRTNNEAGNIKPDVPRNQHTGSEAPGSNVEELIKSYVTTEPRYAIKLYNLSTFPGEVRSGSHQRVHEFYEDKFLHPALAIRKRTRRSNFHELEISDISVRRKRDRYFINYPPVGNITTAGTQVTTTSVALRYEYQHVFFKHNTIALKPSIGIAGSAFYERFKTVPYTTNIYPLTETYSGIRGFIVPRLNWHVGKRLFFDINVPLCFMVAGYRHSNLQDPTIPVASQRFGLLDVNVLPPYYSFRVGAGWTF